MNTEALDFDTTNVLNSALAAGKALGGPIKAEGREPMIIIPEGFKAEVPPHQKLAPLPDHVIQSVTLNDCESFAAYVKRYQNAETVIFASLPTPSTSAQFLAIFDYHAAQKDGEADKQARRAAHRATYPCPYSPEWKLWTAVNGQALHQAAFIEFIDQNTPDIVTPDSATLMQLAMNFESRTNVKFRTAVDRVTGGRQLTFVEQVETGPEGNPEKVKVPEVFTLRLPVFEGGTPFEQKGRFEWRPSDGKLKVTIQLYRPEETIRTALDALRADIVAATEIEPLTGSPK